MENFLNTPVKELIRKFPEIGEILEEYKIGCVSCSAGSCLLKDIIEVHNLSKDEEYEVMLKISKTLYAQRTDSIPKIEKKITPSLKEINYSPPIKKLVEEHTLIKRWLNLIPEVIKSLNAESNGVWEVINEGANFIRFYADKFHHAKEEDILFKYFDESLGIIKAMLEDHEIGRGYVRTLIASAGKKDKSGITNSLLAYQKLLSEHIKKEDEILYPWMDRNLSLNQIGQLFSKFNEVEEQGNDIKERYENFIENLEKNYK